MRGGGKGKGRREERRDEGRGKGKKEERGKE